MKVKGEGKNFQPVEGAMRGRVSALAYLRTRGRTPHQTPDERRYGFSQKGESLQKKEDDVREKVHLFLFHVSSRRKKIELFRSKTSNDRNKSFTFALDKTHFPFLPAALRRPYSVSSWAFSQQINAHDLWLNEKHSTRY